LKTNQKTNLICWIVSFFAAVQVTSVYAGELSTSGQGSRAIGMGGAFTGVADDGSSIYYNPAGISQIDGTTVENGAVMLFPKITYKSNGATQKCTKDVFGPSLFITHPLNDKFTFGFGMYSPYARDADFRGDPANGFYAQRAKILRVDYSPVISYKVSENFSIGGGLVIGCGQIDQSIPTGLVSRIKDKSDGTGYGGILGLLWKVDERTKIGATYRSRMTIEHEGDRTIEASGVSTRSDSRADVHYPSSIGLGISHKLNEKLTLAADVDWYEWSYMNKITTKTDLWPDSTTYLKGDDSWDFRFGTEYKFSQDWTVRAGYAYVQGAIPNTHILPCKPDADSHEFNIGIGKKLGNWTIDLLYTYLFTEEEKPSNNIYGYNGEFNIAQHMIGLTASCRF
jgi:long-chain fatty acid transport protein